MDRIDRYLPKYDFNERHACEVKASPDVVIAIAAAYRPESDPFFRHFFGDRDLGAPQQRVQRSLGSGVIVDGSGIIITNHHVIANSTDVRVALSDRREFDCDVILSDQRTDLAVLRVRDPGGEHCRDDR